LEQSCLSLESKMTLLVLVAHLGAAAYLLFPLHFFEPCLRIGDDSFRILAGREFKPDRIPEVGAEILVGNEMRKVVISLARIETLEALINEKQSDSRWIM